jgi:hypothetical protein
MPSARSLRVVTFVAPGPESAVDAVLRDRVLPRLLASPGIDAAWVGRSGTGSHHSRVLATTWVEPPSSVDEPRAAGDASGGNAPADIAALADDALEPFGGAIVEQVEQVELAIDARFERPEPARILRVFRGRARTGERDAYVAEARAGMNADAEANAGLVAFALGTTGDDDFLTVSAWTGWDEIEAATGGTTRRPDATRNARRLAAFAVTHHEILPETPVHLRRDPESPSDAGI